MHQVGSKTISEIECAFTVNVHSGVRPPDEHRQLNDHSYDLAVLRFEDDGRPVHSQQLARTTELITAARKSPNGAVVVLFIHGWHHNAEWNIHNDEGDSHFQSFRRVLSSLALREAERYFESKPGGRRVVGVYLSWNGDPVGSILRKAGPLSHLSFWNRYSTAKQIGESSGLRESIGSIVSHTKQPLREDHAHKESPLILIGHSMGALILESVVLALLNDSSHPLEHEPSAEPRPVETRRGQKRIAFPDVMIALNSAADSTIFKLIKEGLKQRQLSKRILTPGISYSPPLLISVTASADNDTKVVWRAANVLLPGHTTDGHDATLFTHSFAEEQSPVTCARRGFVDFGQNWHCVRTPEPIDARLPRFRIDLPIRDRNGIQDEPPFARYLLNPLQGTDVCQIAWVFQVPPEVVANHNDVFNSRSSSLLLALIQLSGAVMSLAEDWQNTFEA